jgi:REP element-mobilizing transposase RayT
MRQQQFFSQSIKIQHGGSLATGKRRSVRPLSSRLSLHITLKSHQAIGGRCLFRHKKMILRVMKRAAAHFRIKIYNYAICGNHLHLLIKGSHRQDLQNFFRVFAGHVAQNILAQKPLTQGAGGAPRKQRGCRKNQRRFWSYLLYSRTVSWGREFRRVVRYIDKNVLELLQVIAYQPRQKISDSG